MLQPKLLRGIPSVFALGTLLFASGCGTAAGVPPDLIVTGPVSFALSDAASNEVESFVVELTHVQLVRPDQSTFNALSTPVDVDFAQLRDASGLVRLLNVPVGTYSSARITLNFGNARCVLVGQTEPATLRSDQGLIFTGAVQITVPLQPELQVVAGNHELLEVELDLDQSLAIDPVTNVVECVPTFVPHTDPAAQRPVGIGAKLSSVDVADSSFVLTLYDANGSTLGNVGCTTDGSTVFQVNGVPSVGAVGLSALATLPIGTWVEGLGDTDPLSPTLNLTRVYAGNGTWNGGTDVIEGDVVDVAVGPNPTFLVQGQSSNAAHTSFLYDTTFVVLTSQVNSHVVRDASADVIDTDAINVGQHVVLYGTLAGATLNATVGVLRMQRSDVFGLAANPPASGLLVLDLLHVGRRGTTLFQWTDGGASPADPDAFVTEVGTLADTLGIVTGTEVGLRGFFSPVSDSGPDFVADAAVNAETAPALLLVRNRISTGFSVGLTTGATGIDIAITGVAVPGEVAVIDRGPSGAIALPSAPTPVLAAGGITAIYTLRDVGDGTVTSYVLFDDFRQALADLIAGGSTVRHVSAVGSYDAPTNTLSADLASIVLQ